jgi:hypothetical protein
MAALAGRPQRAAAGRRPQGPTMCIVGPRYAAAGGMQRRRISNNFQTNLHVSNTGGRWLEFCLVVACRREGLRVRSCQCRFPTRTEYSYYSDSDGSDSLAGWTQLDNDALTESLARRDESGLTSNVTQPAVTSQLGKQSQCWLRLAESQSQAEWHCAVSASLARSPPGPASVSEELINTT